MLRTRTVLAGLGLTVLLAACTPAQMAMYMTITEPTRSALTNDQLYRLRMCESTNNYAAVNPSGKYRGAYQFGRTTWDGVAARHFPFLIGADPAATEWYWQDAMARALYSERGRQPWPHCGLRI